MVETRCGSFSVDGNSLSAIDESVTTYVNTPGSRLGASSLKSLVLVDQTKYLAYYVNGKCLSSYLEMRS